MVEENTEEFAQEEATVSQEKVGAISARMVSMHRSVAGVVRAEKDVTIRQGAAREVRAHDVAIRQGAVMTLDAERVQMTQGAAMLVRSSEANLGPGTRNVAVIADNIKLDQSAAQFLLARDSASLDQCLAGIVVGQRVTAKDSTAVLMFADSVEGNVSVVMDRQMAITFGAALGAAMGLVLAIFGILKRKK